MILEQKAPRHVQVPTSFMHRSTQDPRDVVVYTFIKKHMDKATLIAYPSITTISNETSFSRAYIVSAINRLVQNKDIEVVKGGKGHSNRYKFNKNSDKFEMYSYDFLEDKEYSINVKMVILILQQYMFKDEYGIGKISYSFRELSLLTGLSRAFLSKSHKELEELGILSYVDNKKSNSLAGIKGRTMKYSLKELHQEFITVKKQVEENTEDINQIKKQLVDSRRETEKVFSMYTDLQRQINELKKKL